MPTGKAGAHSEADVEEDEGGGKSPYVLWPSAALTLGLLDAARAILSPQAQLVGPSEILAIAATTTVLSVVPLGLAYLLVVVATRRVVGSRRLALEIAIFALFFAFVVFVPPIMVPRPRLGAILGTIPGLIAPLITALAFGAVTYGVVGAMFQSKDYRGLPTAAVVLLPLLVAEICIFARMGALESGPGTRLGTAALNVFLFVVLIATSVSARRLGNRWSVAGLVIVAVGVFGGALPVLRAPSKSEEVRKEEPVGGHALRRVILLTVDTLRADAVSCYGGQGPLTPAMDALAADGIRFAAARSPAPWTLPAVASILTGVAPSAHGMTKVDHVLPPTVPTLAEILRSSGYRTGAIVDNPLLVPDRKLSRGFDHYDFFPRAELPRAYGTIVLERLFRERFRSSATPDHLTTLASEWVRAHAEEDFLLWVHYFDPHVPYEPPPRFRPEGPAPEKFGFRFTQPLEVAFGTVVPTLRERQWIRSLYDGEVRFVDESIGNLIDTLKELSLYDDSLIILTSDHGEEFWEHGSYFHGQSLYGELLNVPLIVKLPGSAVKRTVKQTVSLTAIMPTMLELGGIETDLDPATAPSFAELLTMDAPPTARQTPVISEAPKFFTPRVAIEVMQRKYIRDLVTDGEEVYDLSQDPVEARSIADSIGASVRGEMRTILETHEQSSQLYRDALGIDDQTGKLDPVMIQKLRALGYTQ